MIIGIVGAEAAKFTALGEARAKAFIRSVLSAGATRAVSGHCHLGGVDIWTEEIAAELGVPMDVCAPKRLQWEGGYKQRNLEIAHACDACYCITVDALPEGFTGMTFPVCYHCARVRRPVDHVKSGGCWTVIQAMRMGKDGVWYTVHNT